MRYKFIFSQPLNAICGCKENMQRLDKCCLGAVCCCSYNVMMKICRSMSYSRLNARNRNISNLRHQIWHEKFIFIFIIAPQHICVVIVFFFVLFCRNLNRRNWTEFVWTTKLSTITYCMYYNYVIISFIVRLQWCFNRDKPNIISMWLPAFTL